MELKVQPRTQLKKKVHALRKAGFLPGVVYGEKVQSQSVQVLRSDFMKIFRRAGESTIFKLKIEGGKDVDVLIYGVTFDPLKDIPEHVDFYAVSLDRVIRHKVPVEFVGEAPAVKQQGGILVKVMQEIEIEALPKDLPRTIEVDITGLQEFNSRIYVRDLTFPKGVKLHGSTEDVVVLVEAPRSEEELKAMEEVPAVAAEVAEVKTEREVKVEEKVKKETEEKAPE